MKNVDYRGEKSSVAERGQSFTEATKEPLQNLAGQASEVAGAARDKAKEIGSLVTDKARELKSAATEMAGQARDKVQELSSAAVDTARNLEADVTEMLRRYPLQSIGVCFAAGFLLGHALTRR